MSRWREPELPNELKMIEERLRRGRTQATSPDLDRLKRRALAQSAADRRKPTVIWSRIIAATTALVLLGGVGGAVALSGLDSHTNSQGGAAARQYKHHKYCTHGNPPPGKKCKGVGPGKGHSGYGHKHHHHHASGGQAKAGKGHNVYGSRKSSHHHHHHHHHRSSHRPKHLHGFTG